MATNEAFGEHERSKILRESDRELISETIEYLNATGIGAGRMTGIVNCLVKFSNEQTKSLAELTPDDIIRWLNKERIKHDCHGNIVKNKQGEAIKYTLKPRTANLYRSMVAHVYQKLLGKKAAKDYMEQIPVKGGAKIAYPRNKLLSKEERYRIVRACKTLRDQAMVAILSDTGARINEVVGLRGCDITVLSDGRIKVHLRNSKITLRSEQGEERRENSLVDAIQYVRNYLNTFDKEIFKSEQPLFPIQYHAAYMIVIKAAAEAGIDKKAVNPHAWRHARATEKGKILHGESLNADLGWARGSKQAGQYDQTESWEISDKVYEQETGMVVAKQTVESSTMKCSNCNEIVPPTSIYCLRCGIPVGSKGEELIIKDKTLLHQMWDDFQALLHIQIQAMEALPLPKELEQELKEYKEKYAYYKNLKESKAEAEPIF